MKSTNFHFVRSRFLRECDLFLKIFDITKSDDRQSNYEQSIEQKVEQKREHYKSLVDSKIIMIRYLLF